MKTCSVEGCGRSDQKLRVGMCVRHYQRSRKYGDPNMRLIPERFEDRFWSKVEKTPTCWNWTGALNAGYGAVKRHGVQGPAHRFSYEMARGPIPAGMPLDHICRNRACVNPEHLRVATQKQNRENLSQAGRTISGARGVSWWPEKSKWLVRVGHQGESIYVGAFLDLEEAKAAAVATRNELYTHNDADRMSVQ